MIVDHWKNKNVKLRKYSIRIFIVILIIIIVCGYLYYRKELKLWKGISKRLTYQINFLKGLLKAHQEKELLAMEDVFRYGHSDRLEYVLEKYNMSLYKIKNENFVYPFENVNDCYITSEYGRRYRQNVGWEFHSGTDFVNSKSTEIVSISFGKVIRTGFNKFSGKYVIVYSRYDDEEFKIFYTHLSEISVNEGQTIQPHEKVGEMGMSGEESTGLHLHLAIYKREKKNGIYYSENFFSNCIHREKLDLGRERIYSFLLE